MDYPPKNIWWRHSERLRDLLYAGFVFFMPFTQALTFNIGFPLKFSELFLLMLGGLYILLHRRVRLPGMLTFLLSTLFIAVTVSLVVNLFWDYPYLLRKYATRFGYTGDSLAKYAYFIIALLSLFVSVDIFLQDRRRYVSIWVYGSITAALYAWYLTSFSALRLPVYLLPGMDHPPQTIDGNIIRCGTFLEGNIMGLYLVLSAAMAFYIKKIRSGIFLLVSVITTFSTLSILSCFLFILIYLQHILFKKRYLGWALGGLAILGVSFYFFSGSPLFKKYVADKLFASTDTKGPVAASAVSKIDRLYTFRSAYATGWNNPIWGVGMSNFSRHYERYLPIVTDSSMHAFMQKKDAKVIPNNIYVEVFTEAGIPAFLLYVTLLISLLYYARTDSSRSLMAGLFCMLLCFLAYPSFIMIYLWSFMALPIADFIIYKSKECPF